MISWPWDSLVDGIDEETGFPKYDRAYRAEQLRTILMKVFSEGVFAETPEAFVVTPNGRNITVSGGTCHIRGDIGVETSTITFLVSPENNLDRIDTVVLRWDGNIDAREITIDIKKGTPAVVPQRPALTRIESVWELGIADIYLQAGAASIIPSRVTDTRLETARCGIVTPFTTIDTTTFFNQIQNYINLRIGDVDDMMRDFEARIDRDARELEAEAERVKELADALINETFVGQVMEILETLAKKHVLYLSIDDDATDSIDDDNGDRILGDVKFDIGGSGGCECEAATDSEIDALFDEIRKAQNG